MVDSVWSEDANDSELVSEIAVTEESSEDSGATDASLRRGISMGLQRPPRFATQQFRQVIDGLRRITWCVYPASLATCLRDAAKLSRTDLEDRLSNRPESRLVRLEVALPKQLINEAVPFAFEKCLADVAVQGWADNIQSDILTACFALAELTAVRIQRYTAAEEYDPEEEDELITLLAQLKLALDPDTEFAQRNADQLPPITQAADEASPLPRPPGAEPLIVSSDMSDSDDEGATASAAKKLLADTGGMCAWQAAILNEFIAAHGFEAAQKYLEEGHEAIRTLALYEALLGMAAQAMPYLVNSNVSGDIKEWVEVWLMRQLSEMLAADDSVTTDRERQPMVSSIFTSVYDILLAEPGYRGPVYEQVAEVHRAYIGALVKKGLFARHLAALRELESLVSHAERLPEPQKVEAAVNSIIGWLEKEEVLPALLRANLHTRQYADLLGRVLKRLAPFPGGIADSDLTFLWDLTQKTDTFEAVRVNVYNLLGELAVRLKGGQVDLLFGKFEEGIAAGAAQGDRLLIGVLRRMVESDRQGRLTDRVLPLLWRLALDDSPERPAKDGPTRTFVEALFLYDTGQQQQRHLEHDWILKCVEEIRSGPAVLQTLTLLSTLASLHDTAVGDKHGAWVHQADMLETKFGLSELVLAALERYQVAARAAAAAEPASPTTKPAGAAHSATVAHFAAFLQAAAAWRAKPMPWDRVERLWTQLVVAPVLPSDRDVGFDLFRHAAKPAGFLDDTGAQTLLRDHMPQLDPAVFNSVAFSCFNTLFERVAMDDGKVEAVGKEDVDTGLRVTDINLTGVDFLWRLVLDAPEAVSASARALLVDMHTQLGGSIADHSQAVRTAFLKSCTDKLLQAAAQAGPGLEGEPNEEQRAAALRCSRCMALMLQVIEQGQGNTMPSQPAHGASFRGPPVDFDVQAQIGRRFRVASHMNAYVGALRRQVAQELGVAPETVRLIISGGELRNDALLLRDLGAQPPYQLQAMVSPKANSYTQLRDSDANSSPTQVLASQAGLMQALQDLADGCLLAEGRTSAVKLLEALPTQQAAVKTLADALTGVEPEGLYGLLCEGCKPQRLLYYMQVMAALLLPVSAPVATAIDLAAVRAAILGDECAMVLTCALHELFSRDTSKHDAAVLTQLGNLAISVFQTIVMQPASVDQGEATSMSVDGAGGGASSGSAADSAPSSPARGPAEPPAAAAPAAEAGSQLKPITLKQLLDTLAAIAHAAGCGWDAPLCTQALDGDPTLPVREAQLARAAWQMIAELLAARPDLLDGFLKDDSNAAALLRGLLNPYHGHVRLAAQFVLQRITAAEPRCRVWLLRLLGTAQALIMGCNPEDIPDGGLDGLGQEYYASAAEPLETDDSLGAQMEQFYNLFEHEAAAVSSAREGELGVASALLNSLAAALPRLTPSSPTEEARLAGQLRLLAALVKALDRRSLGIAGRGDLVGILIRDFLFPESVAHTSLEGAALTSRCTSEDSRQAALDLLLDLMVHDGGCLREGTRLLTQAHFQTAGLSGLWNHQPLSTSRNASGYVGLRNGGATCYMNSVFQQLFMQPAIRQLILSGPEEAPNQRADSVFYQMQSIFGHLALGQSEAVHPRSFWRAFRDYDGSPINVREHQDAYEFFTRLQDLLDSHLRAAAGRTALQPVMCGRFAQQIICKGVQHRSEKEEEFFQVSVDVRGKATLEASLDFYVQGELMEGDNAYFYEDIDKKVDAVKRNCFKVLPHTLVVHLKRFEYDYETMNRLKIKDRFEFPLRLDMHPYTVDGLAEAEAAASAKDGEAPATDAAADGAGSIASRRNMYQLKGIVVHSGTAFAGHYYSYIQERHLGPDGTDDGTGQWYCFDDNTVEPWDIAELDKDCFGGKYVPASTFPGVKQQEYDRPNSAYMLFYERLGGNLALPEAAAAAAVSAAPSPAPQPADTPAASSPAGAPRLTAEEADTEMAGSPEAGPQLSNAAGGAIQAVMVDADSASARAVRAILEGSPQSTEDDEDAAMAMTAAATPPEGVGVVGAAAAAAADAAAAEPASVVDQAAADTSSAPRPYGMPASVFQSVMQDNLRVLQEKHTLTKPYFRFMRQLVEARCQAGSSKMRRTTGTSPQLSGETGSEATSAADRQPAPSRRGEDFDAAASEAMDIATSFLFSIYVHAHLGLRDDMQEWAAALAALMDASRPTAAAFIADFVAKMPAGALFLDNVPHDVRDFVVRVLTHALPIAMDASQDAEDRARGDKAVGDLARALALLISRPLPADGGPQVSTGIVLDTLEPLVSLSRAARRALLEEGLPNRLSGWLDLPDPSIGRSRPGSHIVQSVGRLIAPLLRSSDLALGEAGSGANPFSLDRELGSPPPVPISVWGPLQQDSYHHLATVVACTEGLCTPALVQLGAFLSWESEAFSARLLPLVLKELARVSVQTLPLAAMHADSLLYLEDSHCQMRLACALDPTQFTRDNNVHGLVDMAIAGPAKDLWPLLDLLCRIAERSPAAMQQVREHIANGGPAEGVTRGFRPGWQKMVASLQRLAALPGAVPAMEALARRCAALAPPPLAPPASAAPAPAEP